MARRPSERPGSQVTLGDRLWMVALLLVAFADVIAVQFVLPLLGR